MAKIEQYQSEVQAQGPVGAVTPNLEQVGVVGNALKNLGGAVEQVGDVIQRRDAQAESANAYATFSKARADLYDEVNDATANSQMTAERGEAVKQKLQDLIDSESDGYTTAVGKNYFNRQAARLSAGLQMKISAGIAHTSGQNVATAVDSADANNQSAVYKNPESFADVLQSQHEFLDSQVQAGVLTKAQAAQAAQNSAHDYSLMAIRGLAVTSPEAAQKVLDSGYFVPHLGNKGMDEAQRLVTQAAHASDAQSKLSDKKEQDDEDIKDEETKSQLLDGIYNGKVSTKNILESDLSESDKEHMINVAEKASQRQFEKRPQVVSNLMDRILSPDNDPNHIGSLDQLLRDPKSNVAEQKYVAQFLAKDPETKQLNANRKLVQDAAKAQILYSTMPGGAKQLDPDGYSNLATFNAMLAAKEKQYAAEGKPLSTLYDPNNKDYPGNLIKPFIPNAMAVMQKRAALMQNQAAGINPTPTPVQIETTPGVPVSPTPTPTPSPKNPFAAVRGKTAAETVENMRKAGLIK